MRHLLAAALIAFPVLAWAAPPATVTPGKLSWGASPTFAPFEFQEHMFLGREMKEESAVCDSGGRNDRADVGVCHAAPFELGDGSSQ